LKQVLPTAAGQLHLVFQKEGRVDFTEVASAARYALGTADTPTELAFILDCRIEHLLVDEFQDTSETQYQLLERLIGDWQVGDGRTLFLVGDPMQSIYGFREAEVALFLRARQTGIGNIPLEQIVLSVNFRSTFDIVRWVNQGLGPAFPDIEDTYTGAVAYSPSVAFTGSGHDTDDTDDTSAPDDSEEAVTIHAYLDSDAEPEARQVLEIVRYTERINPQGTIAVLVRARSHLASIVSEFRRAEVQFQAVELAPLGERPVVGDLLALTRALIHPADRIAWLSILRAPWCGLTLVDLHFLVGGDDTSAVWDLIRDPERAGRLSPESGRRLARVIAVLDQALPRYGRVGLRRWVEATWMSLGGPASVNDATDLEDASVFLDLLEDSTAGVAIEDEAKFVDDVRRLYAKPNVDAPTNEEGKVLLQLLTVHKAKGLEFDTVILPGLGRYTRGQSASLMLWLEYADRNGRDRLLLAPAKETGRSDDALYAYLGRVKAKKSDHEDTRMLYVAATRARKKLHLLGHTRVDPKGAGCMPPDQRSPLRKIWPAVRTDFESAFAVRGVVDVGDETEAVRPIDVQGIPLRRLSADWSPPPPTTESGPKLQGAVGMVPEDEEGAEDPVVHPTFDWATELQRRVGIVVHAMLQRMSADGRLEWRAETVTSALVSEGLAGEKLAEAARRVNAALERTVSDDRGIWILAEHEDDGRELALTGVVDDRPRNIIIDRTFVDSGVRWIIDYKTGTHEGGGRSAFLDNEQRRYAPQLEKYGRVMQQIEERPIRLALYYPMLQGWREWPFEGLAPA
jgi:ATP-dependent exoDNAse (exonuclease V) beta subunit